MRLWLLETGRFANSGPAHRGLISDRIMYDNKAGKREMGPTG